ncbi:glycosyltransferase [Ferruginibacter yonginensis]|uniref:Glycosyltransferase n=1 Tax=Ferruginibacter yonginensis TaxID=1310416 RepID=A0ABV8QM16_9BACT
MISVIICSVDDALLQAVRLNIAQTIGVPHEILVAHNKGSDEGICSVYNRLAATAQFAYVCFIHEDVVLHTADWGHMLMQAFEDNKVGLVGISGTVYKSAYAAVWSACDTSLYRVTAIQHFKQSGKVVPAHYNPQQENYSAVAVIDGVLMATTKVIWQQHPFNEGLLKGFHCYDIDFSLQIHQAGYHIKVLQQVLLEHFSEGKLNESWLLDSLALHKRYAGYLPLVVGNVPNALQRKSDYMSLVAVLSMLLQYKGYKAKALRYYFLLITRYFQYNRLQFTKQVLRYLVK